MSPLPSPLPSLPLSSPPIQSTQTLHALFISAWQMRIKCVENAERKLIFGRGVGYYIYSIHVYRLAHKAGGEGFEGFRFDHYDIKPLTPK